MNSAVNIPTRGDSGEATTLAFRGEISWEFAAALEELGFDGLLMPDHLMTGNGSTTECLTTVTGLAGELVGVYLYPTTINAHLRHPPLLMKSAATVDNISGGRLTLGIGAGWKADEAVAYGYDCPNAPDRSRETEKKVEKVRAVTLRLYPESIGEGHPHLVGTPERVIGQIQGFVDLGIDEVVVEFTDFRNPTARNCSPRG